MKKGQIPWVSPRKTEVPRPEAPQAKLTHLAPEGTLRWYSQAYEQWMREMNYSHHTITSYRCFIGKFLRWTEERGILKPRDVSQALIERYQKSLYQSKNADGEPVSVNTQRVVALAIHSFFRWMRKRGHLPFNPAADIELPRREYHLPKHTLSISDVEKILGLPDVEDAVGLRDRAMLELFYSSGIRRSELAHLKIYDIDRTKGAMMVRQGKGNRDRMLPVGERALHWLGDYLLEARPALVTVPDHGFLFVMRSGGPMRPEAVGDVVSGYIRRAKLKKQGSCHLFRHAMALQMLENGADIKFIQQMLGHRVISSTENYTNMSMRRLKELHSQFHPARLKKKKSRD